MRTTFRMIAGGIAAAAAAVSLSAPAWAHVEVSGTDATEGGYGVLTFRVPTESDTAATTDVSVTLPDDQPIVSVSTQPKPGWTANVTRKQLATPQTDDDGNTVTDYVSTIEWKADDPKAGIPPNQFDTFAISAGPLPREDMVFFPVVQTYSDGKVVDWNEKTAMGQPEPEHPAPMLMLSAGGPEHGAPVPAADEATGPDHAAAPPAATPAWPGITALVISIGAVLLGVANLVILRRKG